MHRADLGAIDIPVPGYVIQSGDGTNILIDTGFPYEAMKNPQPFAPPGVRVEMREEDFIVNRLATIGLRPEDIDILVCTHFDTDHAGNHDLFPNAEPVVQRGHYEFARRIELERFANVRERWDHLALRYRFVDGDAELIPGVELIETSGHVPGHQAVLVRLPETGTVILAIDAIPHSSMLDAETRWVMPIDMDERGTRESTRKLVELARRENAAFIVHGHDSEQWKTLKHAPEFYS
ncbi:MAG: N-acyl homoserine lactone hydrolase [uncultured Pyrinomonadaceae bacterium]|uniref:N-acyl homoserine lactone hydrolase n=1 Tax=uncultured Pyrinomonadaceae bacterium TaxID=2283094 RepID=A0A6J4NI05_9BACT|nr:MAG: N-acyl homoserine lactone hydrolase [uncultured Pyrinomonadaceae bacterium]